MDFALDAGAEDVVEEDSEYQVLTMPEDFDAVREALAEKGVSFLEAAISMIPKNTVDVTDPKPARQLLRLLENIEDHEDVQNVSANFDIPDEIMEEVS